MYGIFRGLPDEVENEGNIQYNQYGGAGEEEFMGHCFYAIQGTKMICVPVVILFILMV